MDKNISYWFGAGAESGYGLPQGSEFTKTTLLDYTDELYNALSVFYKEITHCPLNWAPRYNRSTPYSEYIGRQIIVKTVQFLINTNHPLSIEDLDYAFDSFFTINDLGETGATVPKLKELISKNKSKKEVTKIQTLNSEDLETIIDLLKLSDQIPKTHPHFKLLKAIEGNLTSYGVIEKYFHTIIKPQDYGPVNYWKLINYYWQAYFTVMLPLCDYLINKDKKIFEQFNFKLTEEANEKESKKRPIKISKIQNNYTIFLTNLRKISKILWSNNTLKFFKTNSNHYYNHPMLKKAVGVITTNYTPIINIVGSEKVAHVNGCLKLFEYPLELEVHDFSSNAINSPDHKMFFPFIFGTSSIKPVIDNTQLQQLHKMKNILEESDILVIIGYGINEDDNHLNSFIRSFLMRNCKEKTNFVIYCAYRQKGKIFDESEEKRKILNLLRIYGPDGKVDDHFRRLKIIRNVGCPNTLFDAIEKTVTKIKSE